MRDGANHTKPEYKAIETNRGGMWLKVKLGKEGRRRKISQDILEGITSSISPILTPKWNKGQIPLKRFLKYDVAQAWMNNIAKKRLISAGFKAEVDPFSGERSDSIIKRQEKGPNSQAIDFEKKCRSGKRHVIEVECGNVGSLYRSVHKICMAMKEKKDIVGIVVVPNRDLISRCDSSSAMSHSDSARVILSEWAYYHPEAGQINIIEFSSDEEVNIAELNDNPKFWKGNWSDEMEEYLDKNPYGFLKPHPKAD